MVFCPVVAVVMLESRVARCVHCADGVACQANSDLLVISCSSTCFGRLYAHHREVGLRFTAYGFCPVVAVVMLESRVARCVHCEEDVASNSYNRTETISSETQSDLQMMGVKKPEIC